MFSVQYAVVAPGTNPSCDWSWRIITEPVATTPALFDEALHPDLNGDQNNPTPVGTLESGENLIRGTHALVESGSGQGDSYSVSVPAGLQIVSVELSDICPSPPARCFSSSSSTSLRARLDRPHIQRGLRGVG